ncbi:hypothetical protein PFISCL1PPCAC_15871, partial [Pristionchus fissidentatus]
MAPTRIHEDIRRLLRNDRPDASVLIRKLESGGHTKTEIERELQKLEAPGEIIEVFDKQKRTICLTKELKDSSRPISLRPRLDLSRRIIESLSKHRRARAEVDREEMKTILMRVHRIENFSSANFESYFDFGLQEALRTGKIEKVGDKYRSNGMKLSLICSICDNKRSDSHERKLECIHCRSQRHASCMGLRKHKLLGDFECELCSNCSSCDKQPTRSNPLAWCPQCYKPKHLRGCGRRNDQIGEAALAALPTVHLCTDCGGKTIEIETKETDPQPSTSTSNVMATPDKGVGKLSDSLTAYFTPSCEGRRRHRQINTHDDSTSEDDNEGQKLMCPLTVEVSRGAVEGIAGKTPPSSSSSTHRRAEQLQDALSPYFTAGTGKRRSVVKGEYARLNGSGGMVHPLESSLLSPSAPGPSHCGLLASPRRGRGRPPRSSSLIGSPPSSAREEEEEEEE